MDGRKNKHVIADTESDLLSALDSTVTNDELTESILPPDRWKHRDTVWPFVYIDDTKGVEKLWLDRARIHASEGRTWARLHAKKSETFFNRIAEKSSQLGMKINGNETQMLCVSASKDFDVSSYVQIGDAKIESTDTLNIMGLSLIHI